MNEGKIFCLEKNVVYIRIVAQVPNIAIRIKTTIVIALSTSVIVPPQIRNSSNS